ILPRANRSTHCSNASPKKFSARHLPANAVQTALQNPPPRWTSARIVRSRLISGPRSRLKNAKRLSTGLKVELNEPFFHERRTLLTQESEKQRGFIASLLQARKQD